MKKQFVQVDAFTNRPLYGNPAAVVFDADDIPAETMQKIVDVHFPDLKGRLVSEAMRIFYDMRDVAGLKKKPSTSELLDWLKLLLHEDIDFATLKETDSRKLIPPLAGALLKNEQDVHLFERIAFMSRRKGE